VLWHTEIEGQPPAEIAPLLGLTPNGVSALAYRAREGLRQAYLQMHLADRAITGASRRERRRCRAASERLGAWIRGGLSKRETAQVEQHLDECERCRTLATELADVNGCLRAFVAPLVLGGAAAGYLASTGANAGTALSSGAAGATATAGAGAIAEIGSRQLLALGGSTAALVAAVVVGVLAGSAPQAESQAGPPPNRSVPVRSPSQPSVTPTTPAQPVTQPPEPATTSPAPAPPSLTVSTSHQEIALDAGGDPATLQITVRNASETQSQPVTVLLSLPGGLTATGTGTGSAPLAAALQLAPGNLPGEISYAPGKVTCTGGTGKIGCSTGQGLHAQGSVLFEYTLRAALDATGGVVTGRVSGGGTEIELPAISIAVRPAPDLLDLQASAVALTPWQTRLDVQASNTGRTSGPVTAAITLPDGVFLTEAAAGCEGTAGAITCTGPLAAGQQASWQLMLGAQYRVTASATVTATLGAAQRQATVPLDLDVSCVSPSGHPQCPPGQLPDKRDKRDHPDHPAKPEQPPGLEHRPTQSPGQ